MDRISHTELDVKESEKGSEMFQCPHCQTMLQFKARIKINSVYEMGASEEEKTERRNAAEKPKSVVKAQSSEKDALLIQAAKNSKIFSAFESAIKSSPNQPNDLEKYFLTFLKRATKAKSSQKELREWVKGVNENNVLELWMHGHLCAITCDGVCRLFVPAALVKGETIKYITIDNGLSEVKKEITQETWKKTRFGYVVGKSLMLKELRQKSIGDFAKASV